MISWLNHGSVTQYILNLLDKVCCQVDTRNLEAVGHPLCSNLDELLAASPVYVWLVR
jgi:hypothetical protein